jgi:hypothetical protein
LTGNGTQDPFSHPALGHKSRTKGGAAAASGRRVLLNWQMAEGQKSGYFNVQRSADAISWQTIGNVTADPGSSGIGSYQFMDEEPLAGMNYYRPQLNDPAGEQYSSVVTAEYQTNQVLICYATGKGTMQARLQNGSNEPYKLLDVSGRLAEQGALQSGQATPGPQVHGLYILLVLTRKGMMTDKIIIP